MALHFSTEEERWHAVTQRDYTAAHAFYYGVKSTGIFCIPGCSSRLPLRKNTVFFNTPDEALQAGFRACKRCRPDDLLHSGIKSARVIAACRSIETDEGMPTLDKLAGQAGLSPSHFQRLFKDHIGLSPKEYQQAIRSEKIKTALESGLPVTQAIMDAGFGSISRFYEKDDSLGMKPSTYKKGGKGHTIRYGGAESFLGFVLVGFTDDGVCSVEFGQSENELVESLTKRFHLARIAKGGPELQSLVSEVIDYIKSPSKGLDLPLDIQGTAFQQRVWNELRNIPPGETRTYSDIAENLGMPRSVRAVANANASNRLAVVIPCHRVVRKDGSLAGYYWGQERKKALLDNEKMKAASKRQ